MTTKHLTTLAIAGAAMFATLTVAIGSAEASDRIRYRCKAIGTADISMAAKYETRASRNRNKFSAEFEAGPGTGFAVGSTLTVIVDGVTVASPILVDVSGDATFDVNFDTRPQLDSAPFPANWPAGVGKGTEVTIANAAGTVLGCTLN